MRAFQRGEGCGPMGNHNTIGFLSNTGSEPTKTRKATKSALMLGHNRPASETPFQWQNRCRADHIPLSRQTFLDPRMTFLEKFLFAVITELLIYPPTSISFYKKNGIRKAYANCYCLEQGQHWFMTDRHTFINADRLARTS